MSRADFWATIATLSLRLTARYQDSDKLFVPNFKFYFGRKDCCHDDAPDYDEHRVFPSPHGNTEETLSFCKEEFGLTPRQCVALLGVHTLGKCRKKNSGFYGDWVRGVKTRPDGRFILDNTFFSHLIDKELGWNQTLILMGKGGKEGRPLNYQWKNIAPLSVMLNSDMALLKDIGHPIIGLPHSNGQVACTYETCPFSSTADITYEYAENNVRWLKDFAESWNILQTNGSLRCLHIFLWMTCAIKKMQKKGTNCPN